MLRTGGRRLCHALPAAHTGVRHEPPRPTRCSHVRLYLYVCLRKRSTGQRAVWTSAACGTGGGQSAGGELIERVHCFAYWDFVSFLFVSFRICLWLQPFWPMGTGCARGFLAAFDTAWMVKSWAQGRGPLEVLAERLACFRHTHTIKHGCMLQIKPRKMFILCSKNLPCCFGCLGFRFCPQGESLPTATSNNT